MQILPIIDTDAALNRYCQVLSGCKAIALDTEFLRVSTFYPKPGLFQINDGENIALIDPLTINDWQAFSAILNNENIVKVLHACDEDIELLHHFLSVEVKNVFDTQVAAAFCAYDFCMGYQRLVAAMFEKDVEKGESRSDWMRRPLSQSQLHYAATDVLYLLDMHEILARKLEEKSYAAFVQEECDGVFLGLNNKDFSQAYKRVKQAWKLNAQQFSVLKNLAAWREEMMREHDLPRNKIAKNEALMALAVKSSWNKKSLQSVDGLLSASVSMFAEPLLAITSEKSEHAVEVMAKPIKAEALLSRMKETLAQLAAEHGIAESMLSKKTYNEAVFRQIKVVGLAAYQIDAVNDVVLCWRQPFYRQALTILKGES